jgi:putative transcriptional regulator
MAMRNTGFALVLSILLGWVSPLFAASLDDPVILVAKPGLHDELLGSSIVVVTPIGNDQHIGFIINRPSPVTVQEAFPEHAKSQMTIDPIYIGGPVDSQVVFALVQRSESPGPNYREILPELYLVIDGPTVDHVIESDADHARLVAGLVFWRPGELRGQVEQGAWFVQRADANVVVRKPGGLWEEFISRHRYDGDPGLPSWT